MIVQPIVSNKTANLAKAASAEIESYWPMNSNVTDFIMNVGADGSGCGALVAAATSPAGG
ncbi:unnamed protein product [Eruca vesicaria subsp. sativa]|uniref:Uncharacterized protein n=1 Tax=Eruca vesicaria subsp. sativa TaxID=29727 RepID=A0ABC8LB98_ERUVS|nr:unnamed protein product [Eruca vesicaria subsp. sativa]